MGWLTGRMHVMATGKTMIVRTPASSGSSWSRATGGWIHRIIGTFICGLALLAWVSPSEHLKAASLAHAEHIVILIGEDEYKTWETLPAFAESELSPRGYEVRVIQQDPTDKHRFPGLVEAMRKADLLIVSVRRRSPPADQLAAIRRHLDEGKALMGIRTASHAFTLREEDRGDLLKHPEREEWTGFDRDVLGGNYHGHHEPGPAATITRAEGVEDHPILQGLNLEGWRSQASLYESGPIADDATALLIGQIPGQPPEPVAWTHWYGPRKARIFYTSLGHETDFANPRFRELLVNAIAWAVGGK